MRARQQEGPIARVRTAGDDHDTEATEHPRMRDLLVPRFSTRRMRLMKPRIEHHVDEPLDEMAAGSTTSAHPAARSASARSNATTRSSPDSRFRTA
ncbi:hypothetical protein ACFRI7_00635 [Streptomyces sp. NPDC056716]